MIPADTSCRLRGLFSRERNRAGNRKGGHKYVRQYLPFRGRSFAKHHLAPARLSALWTLRREFCPRFAEVCEPEAQARVRGDNPRLRFGLPVRVDNTNNALNSFSKFSLAPCFGAGAPSMVCALSFHFPASGAGLSAAGSKVGEREASSNPAFKHGLMKIRRILEARVNRNTVRFLGSRYLPDPVGAFAK